MPACEDGEYLVLLQEGDGWLLWPPLHSFHNDQEENPAVLGRGLASRDHEVGESCSRSSEFCSLSGSICKFSSAEGKEW